jgi:hypothetical protein
MSDTIERDGKTYYEAGYLAMAGNTINRRNERIRELEAERDSLRERLGVAEEGKLRWMFMAGTVQGAMLTAMQALREGTEPAKRKELLNESMRLITVVGEELNAALAQQPADASNEH